MIIRFTDLREEDPSNIDAWVGQARYLRYDGQASEATNLLESEQERFAKHPEFLTELGASYLAQGRTSESKRILERSLEFDPNFWRTYAILGIANDLLHNYDEAAAAHAKALEFCPQSSSIHNNLGISAGSSGDIDMAIVYVSRARDLEPESPIIQNNLTLFRELRSSCPDCSVHEYRRLTKTIHSEDSPVDSRGVSCSGHLTGAQEIVEALVDTLSVDMRVHFAFDSALLRPEGKEVLDELAQAIMSDEMRDDAFVIEGHTDGVGTKSYNQGLSERRATAVREYLMQSGGVQSSRLSAMGYGENRLLDPANPESERNRRVRVMRLELNHSPPGTNAIWRDAARDYPATAISAFEGSLSSPESDGDP